MDQIVEIVVTGPDNEWASALQDKLLSNKLVACAQAWPIRSAYRWQGSVQSGTEIRLALHTSAALAHEVIETVSSGHPYENPCVLAVDVNDGHAPYVQWVLHETRPSTDES